MNRFNLIGKVISRWIGRARAGGQILKIFFLGLTAVNTGTIALKSALTATQLILLNAMGIVLILVFLYFGDRYGLFMSQQRDLTDIQNNFLNPQGSMIQLIRAEQFKVLGKYLDGELSEDEFEDEMNRRTEGLVEKYQGGLSDFNES